MRAAGRCLVDGLREALDHAVSVEESGRTGPCRSALIPGVTVLGVADQGEKKSGDMSSGPTPNFSRDAVGVFRMLAAPAIYLHHPVIANTLCEVLVIGPDAHLFYLIARRRQVRRRGEPVIRL